MELDIEQIRRHTPSCENMIHFNNAGCSLMPEPVSNKVLEYLAQEQQFGGYETGRRRKDELEGFYASAAKLIGCKPDEIAFCDGSTRGWQHFFHSLRLNSGDRIITTRVDYGSNMVAYIQMARTKGVKIDFIATDDKGDLDLESLKGLINEKTKLISISHIPTGCGMVNDAQAVGAVAAQAGIPYLLDACQSIGQLHLQAEKIGCTALSATGRKYLRGPRGTGVLYVARSYFETAEPLFLEQQGVNLIDHSHYELVDSARRFENFECHMAGKLGLAAAMDYADEIGMTPIQNRIYKLAKICRQQLINIPKVTVYDRGAVQCGIVTFAVNGQHPSETRSRLSEHKINIWVSAGPGSLVDFQNRGIDALARASLHYYNTEDEIEKFCDVIARLAQR
ncbi:aminotransferase class V-fold PLP-dependent enzyme [Candidatus Spongiihabitans sp.]|uniref:aminotransferase class V-fold PLP-dependent enzyme n=1 Tax=Candidatus Spongiihabitans sp. TaxID=3101308 RepID=UPI003C7C77B6